MGFQRSSYFELRGNKVTLVDGQTVLVDKHTMRPYVINHANSSTLQTYHIGSSFVLYESNKDLQPRKKEFDHLRRFVVDEEGVYDGGFKLLLYSKDKSFTWISVPLGSNIKALEVDLAFILAFYRVLKPSFVSSI